MAAETGWMVIRAAGFFVSDMMFSFRVERLHDRSRCKIEGVSREAGMSRARSGTAGILCALWAGTRNATKFREPTSGQARRMRQHLHRNMLRSGDVSDRKVGNLRQKKQCIDRGYP